VDAAAGVVGTPTPVLGVPGTPGVAVAAVSQNVNAIQKYTMIQCISLNAEYELSHNITKCDFHVRHDFENY